MRPEILFSLFNPVNKLAGIGPRLSKFIEKAAGPNLIDLLWHLPTGLVTRENLEALSSEYVDREVLLVVDVVKHAPSRNRRAPYRINCLVGDDNLTLVFFNGREDYLRRQLPEGEKRKICGKLEDFNGSFQITHPDHIATLAEESSIPLFEPVYPLTAGLTNQTFIKANRQIFPTLPDLPEWNDKTLLRREEWLDWKKVLLKPTHQLPKLILIGQILPEKG